MANRDPFQKPDFVGRVQTLRRRLRRLETQRFGTPTVHAPRRVVDPIAEWLCFPTLVPRTQFVPSWGAWSLIEAEAALDPLNDLHRKIRMLREKVKAQRPLTEYAGLPAHVDDDWLDTPLARSALDSVVEGYGAPEQTPGTFYLSDGFTGSWLQPVVLPGRPAYGQALWHGTNSFSGGLEQVFAPGYTDAASTALNVLGGAPWSNVGWATDRDNDRLVLGNISAGNVGSHMGLVRGEVTWSKAIYEAVGRETTFPYAIIYVRTHDPTRYLVTSLVLAYQWDPSEFGVWTAALHPAGELRSYDFYDPQPISHAGRTDGYGGDVLYEELDTDDPDTIGGAVGGHASMMGFASEDVVTGGLILRNDLPPGGIVITTLNPQPIDPLTGLVDVDFVPWAVNSYEQVRLAYPGNLADVDGFISEHLAEDWSLDVNQGYNHEWVPLELPAGAAGHVAYLVRYGWLQLRGWFANGYDADSHENILFMPSPLTRPRNGTRLSFEVPCNGRTPSRQVTVEDHGIDQGVWIDVTAGAGERIYLDTITYVLEPDA